MAPRKTPHQKAEAALTAFGLTLPETDAAPGWTTTRCLRVKGRMFAVFGATNEPPDALTIIVKLPLAAEMVRDLYFVRETSGWYRQHNWVIAHFGAGDDIMAEIETLKAWMVQSWAAMAPKKLARTFMAARSGG